MNKKTNTSQYVSVAIMLFISIASVNVLFSIDRGVKPETYYESCPLSIRDRLGKPHPPCTAIVKSYGWPNVVKEEVEVTKTDINYSPSRVNYVYHNRIKNLYNLGAIILGIAVLSIILVKSSDQDKPTKKARRTK